MRPTMIAPRSYDERKRPIGEASRGNRRHAKRRTSTAPGRSPGGPASATPLSLCYASRPFTVREKGA